MTDFVVTYVNGNDPEWQKVYNKTCRLNKMPICSNSARYRDWGFIRYVLRGVATHMPWINNCYMVVERLSQVPEWVNRDTVKIITHDQIIPHTYLPTYNSTVIELFLYRIPGLSEQFIYANDDMIPIDQLREDDFYSAGKPRLKITHHYFKNSMNKYRYHLHNGESLVRKILKLQQCQDQITKTGHNLNPMIRSTWQLLWDKGSERLNGACTPFRSIVNINQEICSYYHILSGNYADSERRTQYMECANIQELVDVIKNSDMQLLCINDKGSKDFERDKETITAALQLRLPDKSKYEL